MHIIKILILGPSGVGKSSIVQQFTAQTFSNEHIRTLCPGVNTQTVMLDNRVYHLKIIDLPPLTSFPQNSLEEWSGGVSVRTASAYLLVYDASNLDTFQRIKEIKDQIYESRDMNNVPFLVVANKSDLVSANSSLGHGHSYHHHHHHHHHHLSPMGYSSAPDSRERRDICSMVRKQWKVGHLQCSARYNWRIIAIFKEITRLCILREEGSLNKDTLHLSHIENFHRDVLHNRENCSIS